MSFTEKRLCNPTQLTTSGQTLYTVPASKTAIIKQLVVTNVTGSAATFSLYIGSATAANALFSATSVAANDAIVINLSQVLNSTEILTALASANSTLNITISGVENDGPLNPLSTYIADGAITSAKIADGTIVNADINASAAIDKTKISGTAITAADTGTVTSTMILDGTIATADIANNAITQAKLSTDVPLSGMRNAFINGNFDIWQRWVATSIDVSAGTTAYTADRWFLSPIGATMGAIRTTNIRSGSTARYVYEITPNGVGGSTCRLGQRIEAANVPKLRGTVTFSAWIYNNTGAAITPNLLLGTPSASDNFTSVTNRLTQALQSCPNATWTQVSYTVDISGYTNLTNGLQIEIETSNHTTYGKIVRISEMQLELGSQPTPFEQRPYGVELALCQRYFVRIVASEVTNGTLLFCRGSDARPTVYYQLPVSPRTTGAQITESGQSYVSNLWTNVVAVSNISQINTSPSSNIVSWCWTTWSSLTAEKVYIWNPNGSNVSISMEL